MFKIFLTSAFLIFFQLFSLLGVTDTAFSEDSVENQIIVRFEKGVSENDARIIAADENMRVIEVLDRPNGKYGQCIFLLGSHLRLQEMIEKISAHEEVDSSAPNFVN
ncbi:hypothetical protein [Desulfovibrio sp. JC010]|uniref:S8 family serine peptidase n=1 Tax=Desulfovibrio sp. JC010 TaxID=2593641 RepID=UPI0013D7CAC5|nr:hypothetical protein [Desulfovibrio sp. JC010]NDV26283.1 hypothetical protein [Desulfovibrio sp. JC010]